MLPLYGPAKQITSSYNVQRNLDQGIVANYFDRSSILPERTKNKEYADSPAPTTFSHFLTVVASQRCRNASDSSAVRPSRTVNRFSPSTVRFDPCCPAQSKWQSGFRYFRRSSQPKCCLHQWPLAMEPEPTAKVPWTAPSLARSLVTFLLLWLVTQTWVPSNATPTGPAPTAKVP